ncbi:MAG: creatininase family protein [Pseudomonadota bacterium]
MTDKSKWPEPYFAEMMSTDIAEAAAHLDEWIAVLPVAATEQHGPHLPLGTDSFINEGLIARFIAEHGEGLPATFLPTQKIGKSDEHAAFPGTLTLTADIARAAWVQIGEALAASGIKRLILLNSHGGNSALLDQVALELRHANMLCVATAWSRLGDSATIFGAEERAYGIHGGDIETSLMLALRPELVRMEEAENFASEQKEFTEEFSHLRAYGRSSFGWRMEDLNRYGVVGNAQAATVEKGEALIEASINAFADLVRDVQKFDLDRFS